MTITPEFVASRRFMMPDPKTVTWYSRTTHSPASSGGVTVRNCERRHPDRRDAAEWGTETLIWHVWRSELLTAHVPPTRGDKLKDGDGVEWIVISATEELLGQRFRLVTTRSKK